MIYAIILGLAIIVGSLFQQFWIVVGVGLAIDLIVFFWIKYGSMIFKKRTATMKATSATKPAGATPTPVGAHASAGTATNPVTKWLWRLGLLVAIGYIAYSVSERQGPIGEYIAEKEYVQDVRVYLTTLEDKEFCRPELPPGQYYATFPDEVAKTHWTEDRKLEPSSGFFLTYRDGQRDWRSFLRDVWVNGTKSGWSKKVTVRTGGCFTITPQVPPEQKVGAVIYGVPRCPVNNRPEACFRSSTPTAAGLTIRFSGRELAY